MSADGKSADRAALADVADVVIRALATTLPVAPRARTTTAAAAIVQAGTSRHDHTGRAGVNGFHTDS
jgi:hypothetical protein